MTRKSVPTAGVSLWWHLGWAYVRQDFDKPDHSIIEWLSERAPVEPANRVSAASQNETEHDDDRRQQPA